MSLNSILTVFLIVRVSDNTGKSPLGYKSHIWYTGHLLNTVWQRKSQSPKGLRSVPCYLYSSSYTLDIVAISISQSASQGCAVEFLNGSIYKTCSTPHLALLQSDIIEPSYLSNSRQFAPYCNSSLILVAQLILGRGYQHQTSKQHPTSSWKHYQKLYRHQVQWWWILNWSLLTVSKNSVSLCASFSHQSRLMQKN